MSSTIAQILRSTTLPLITLLGIMMIATQATAETFYFSDFESDDGGWSGTGDWERGEPNGFNGAPFGEPEPIGGNSGTFAWGTVIGGAHSPSTISVLSQTFDFTGQSNVMLSFFEFLDSGDNTFDMAKVLVNGTEQLLADGGPTNDWREVNLDLSAFDDMGSVLVAFQFSSTAVVERIGWYIDDVELSGTMAVIPEPTSVVMSSIGLLALGGLACRKRLSRNRA